MDTRAVLGRILICGLLNDRKSAFVLVSKVHQAVIQYRHEPRRYTEFWQLRLEFNFTVSSRGAHRPALASAEAVLVDVQAFSSQYMP